MTNLSYGSSGSDVKNYRLYLTITVIRLMLTANSAQRLKLPSRTTKVKTNLQLTA